MTILNKETPTSSDAPFVLNGDPEAIINLKVLRVDNSGVCFRVKMNTPLERVITAYCERYSVSETEVIFQYNGRRVFNTDTPSLLLMEDGDIIDALHSI